ncbi:capsid maturation protease-like protein [Phocid alphaherpesvirus 1]|uniref:Capsid scaffolding protein n=2 Tax=Phocid alphaherpesvirus 1 TaxID=47418 RepID=A0A482F5E5_9ALPH|nr:capsid maturation protease-like protein [Phocid alphaherpesvirus 1]QBN85145.1 capsid maturation protease-like protein [Phocid alphaherpesvirus 1]
MGDYIDDGDNPPIYVAGYLALYDMGDTGELTLTRTAVQAALPPASILPINIDHKSKCIIGAVLAIVDDPKGPFFLGMINCPQLVRVLSSSVNADFFGVRKNQLSKEERLLYLVSNYLPSASLSSRKLFPGEDPDDTLFAHVALCVIGKRVGTIVTYDITPELAIAPFKHLSSNSSVGLLTQAAETKLKLTTTKWDLNEKLLTQALLSTAVNNMLLRDRWELVSNRRREAGITGHVYLQASAQFGLLHKNDVLSGAEFGETADSRDVEKGDAAPVVSHSNINSTRSTCDSSVVQQVIKTIDMASPGAPITSKNPTNGDYILVPSAQYNQLIVSQHAQQIPMPHIPYTQTASMVAPHTPVPYSFTVPQHYPAYSYPPHHSNLEAQISALVGALTAERKSFKPGGDFSETAQRSPPYSYDRRFSRKRKHDWEFNNQREDFDHIYYPGEHPPKISRNSDSITNLIGAVSSLQQEITQLRSLQRSSIKPDSNQHVFVHPQQPTPYQIQPQIITAPVPQSSCNPPVTSQVLPPQPVIIDTQVKPGISSTTYTESGQTEITTQQKPSNYTTIDASASSSINPCVRDDADIFVSQMMNSR